MKTILEIGYHYLLLPADDVGVIATSMSKWMLVERGCIDGKDLYSPATNNVKLRLKLVNDDQLRPPTEEEKEKQKIKDLEQSLKWRKNELKKEKELREALECKLKLFEQEKEETKEA